ncbi:peptidylprolyl isomerase [Alkalimonas mucilaginosa]|uniref:Peptidyl-prolyl cis-trans isomerase n=1 Tax=Alkalimonas mucilaginosa TaxID=3057676 RepID=A0ABU7JGL7_9GAMM|nr:peptidylprolyl isomerase [Alkalimonas sp. MEB004]MEE2024280.1 peptidylprolyl isomerase [Alkalimonas sp. MEB004]
MKKPLSRLMATGLVCAGLCFSIQATIVEFRTSVGTFEVNLFDDVTPKTVENFLKYVEDESYHNSVIHRMVPDFVVQGGGFTYSGAMPLKVIPAKPAVQNEPKLSNRRGTIAMAKVSGNANSATNQWFFNLKDNHAGGPQLDTQNGGFTVFGQVSEHGMEVLERIAALPRYNLGGAADSMPLRNYSNADAAANKAVTAEHLVMIESVVVVDPRSNTAAGLSPVANTLIGQQPQQPDSDSASSLSIWSGLLLLGLLLRRRRFR